MKVPRIPSRPKKSRIAVASSRPPALRGLAGTKCDKQQQEAINLFVSDTTTTSTSNTPATTTMIATTTDTATTGAATATTETAPSSMYAM